MHRALVLHDLVCIGAMLQRRRVRREQPRVGAVFELPNGQLYTLGPGRRAQKIPHL